jgi:ubiquinone/menaquinone biosynthesis C-methylase UbiE
MKGLMYSKFANDYDIAIQNNIYNAHLERPSLQAMLPDLTNKHVLDLGCGTGVYAKYLLENRATVTAIDASSEMIDIVNTKFGDELRTYTQDLSLGLPDEKSDNYDVVICPLTIHYIEDLSLLFNDVKRVLKRGGYFVFSTHHPLVDIESSLSGDYFERELVTEVWDTVGEPVEVKFYRRSLTELFNFISQANLCVVELSEGKPSEAMKEISVERYNHLSTNPNFIFIKCRPNT